ncbi:TRAP transporter small permease [Limnohabitans sp. Bal53]|uniref:TRAP transporter small permease n=1 Tax=Limnohabitans sp. Bal53 TaxID=1977910 RepID=UPI0018EE5676|nr:TRAP transporter small permease [Limnohabitans sp. Bal53]
MAEAVYVLSTRQYQGLGWVLDRLCKLLAILSGLTLLAMAFMSLRSIVGRAFFDAPLLGDFELVQFLCAGAVAMSLPYTHWISGHVIVDFFTANAPARLNAVLDTLANLLLAFFAGLICWRVWVGMLDLRGNFDASMLLEIPTWWAYTPLVPSFALLSLTALYRSVEKMKEIQS